MAYFDNAATTFPKPECIYNDMNSFYKKSGVNVGRGEYALAADANLLLKETRKRLKDLLQSPSKEVVFQPSATLALNTIIQGIINKDIHNIYISPFEHNAVTRVLYPYEQKGLITVNQLAVEPKDLSYDIERIKYQFETKKPELIIMSQASNVCGLIAPVEEIFRLAKKFEAYTVVDMAQTAGLLETNLNSDLFDFAVFAGHKTLYGPVGISGFLMKPNIQLEPLYYGGTGFDSANLEMPNKIPERFEAGTINTLGIAGLYSSINWIKEKTVQNLFKIDQTNKERLLSVFNDFDDLVQVIGNTSNSLSIVSCRIKGLPVDRAGQILNQYNISIRSGLHCAPLAHKFLGTFPEGTLRFSTSYFTTEEDFKELENALEDLQFKILM